MSYGYEVAGAVRGEVNVREKCGAWAYLAAITYTFILWDLLIITKKKHAKNNRQNIGFRGRPRQKVSNSNNATKEEKK